jgi:hypothetical protein
MLKKKEVKNEIEWDRKKIFAFLLFLVGIVIFGYAAKIIVLGENLSSKNVTSVKGVSVSTLPLPDIKSNIQNNINNLKAEAQNINVVDIATSSPQVQKVINDLKAIQDYPKNQLRQTCEKICSGL